MNGPNWKWLAGISITIMGAAFAFYINLVQGQFKESRDENERSHTVIHTRIATIDREKVDKEVLAECLKSINDKLTDIKEDIKIIKSRQR